MCIYIYQYAYINIRIYIYVRLCVCVFFCTGVGLTNQHTLLLYAIPVIVWALFQVYTHVLRLRITKRLRKQVELTYISKAVLQRQS